MIIADAVLIFKYSTASLEDWKNYALAMNVLGLLENNTNPLQEDKKTEV